MKKITLTFLFLAVVFFAGGQNVQAQNSSLSRAEQIKAITEQIAVLRMKIQELTAGVETREEAIDLIKALRQGTEGEEVSVLQAILAADRDIYPEGLITGYFGPRTFEAVRRFKFKHGLRGDGNVDEETVKKLKERIKDAPLAMEDSEEGGRRPCAKVAWGHLVAPGWERKHGNEKPIVPLCRMIPKGIEKKLSDRPTTTPATTTPTTRKPGIESLKVTEITASSSIISWKTNKQADGVIWYTKTRSEIESGSADKVSEDGLSLTHSFTLDDLDSDTAYYYRVVSEDTDGNTSQSKIKSFETKELEE